MRSLALILALAALGCGSSSDNNDGSVGMDLSAPAGPDMAFLSRCGHPGDTGNNLGVGKFCTNTGPDCTGNGMSTTCSALFNGQTPSADDTYFCSFQCQSTDPAGTCGDNATCLCNAQNLCACIPTKCVPPSDGGA
ncbi:MAG TPA: hypothetical protein VN947_36385 [Polyangia bacterium]|nr:hypothetical protein [Polyangia bacterium]